MPKRSADRGSPDLLDSIMKRTKMSQSINGVGNVDGNTEDEDLSASESSSFSGSDSEDEGENSGLSDSETSNTEGTETNGIMEKFHAGVIEKISLKNFMCHDFFELELGPRLNFIIGRNGSGKSAIITGISVGLGAKASDTSRGSSIQDLIKDGKSMARVTIVFRNKGIDSYQPEVFGERIIIERRLIRKGGGGYYIKNNHGKTVSTKKSDIDQILQKYNIRVDNPLSFLSQDKAREFLTSANSKEKFRYFMQGTSVEDIIDNYSQAQTNIQEISSQLTAAQNHESIARKKYNDSLEVYEKFRQSDQLREKLSLLNGKVFWFNVTKIEQLMQKRNNEISTLRASISKIESSCADKQVSKESAADEKLKIREENVKHSETLHQLVLEQKPVEAEQEKTKVSYEEIVSEIKSNQGNIDEYKKKIEEFQHKLIQEIQKSKDNTSETRGQKIARLEGEVKQLKLKKREILMAGSKFNSGHQDSPEYIQAHQRYSECNESIRELSNKLTSLNRAKSDKFSPWGNTIKRLVHDIRQDKSWHQTPLGPIGSYVNVKENFSSWKDLINAVLNKSLDSFLVCDEHDRRKLLNLSRKAGIEISIISRRIEAFDFKNGIPRGETTLVDMLNVSNPQILYTLIDINNIEQSVITEHSDKAFALAKVANVNNVYSKISKSSGRRTKTIGNSNSIANDPVHYFKNAPYKFSEDMAAIDRDIKETQVQIKTENIRLEAIKSELKLVRKQFELDKEKFQEEMKEVNNEIKEKENELNDSVLNDESAEDPITVIESTIKDYEEQIQSCKNMVLSLGNDLSLAKANLDCADSTLQALDDEIQKVKGLVAENEETESKLSDLIIKLDVEVTKLKNEKGKILESVASHEEKLETLNEKLEENQKSAQEICERSIVPISPDDTAQSIQTEYMATQEAVQQAESMVGITFEEAQMQYDKCKLDLIEAEDINRELHTLETNLLSEHVLRLNYLRQKILHNIKDVSHSFEEALDARNFKGKLVVDVSQKTLTMMVAPQDTTEGRNVESLSGGEKSFTQVAFLLSIWKVMNSKVRGLDEFDVFMDSVNRTVSIQLLLEELKRVPNSQTIFITPQDINTIANLSKDSVRIHRMSSPRSG
ncbi:Structural maintenance of chromosomes protein 6 [Yamadazyma tenuis]|uniref:Structural maintenance of chromosomes protein 6 n=1 Tax=Candida tenuis TaxID=2315449 RepID=UPI002799A900|nr:Structural maintenance of chromosomes protein 6 [Yamadazyma tenuis]